MTMKRSHKTFSVLALVALSLALGPASRAQAATATKRHAHKTKAAAAAPAAAGAAKPTEAGKRDPFLPLVNEGKPGGGVPLPPGKAGLVVATVRIDGTVRAPEGMLAVVSNPDQRVYFLREGDRLYDGDVEKIGLDGVTFKENSKDAFGKPVERLVTKRIYPSAGEQQ
jgi:type IV pilus assembly protein PilP